MLRRPWILLLLFNAAPLLAHAEPTSAEIAIARQLFSEALAAEKAEDWTLAADKLREAISIKETAGLRFHLAYCEEQLGRLVEAMVEYDRADEIVRAEPKAARDVQQQLGPKRQALRARIPTLTVLLPADIEDATLQLNGRAILSNVFGKTIPQNPGQHTVVVSAKGRATFTRELVLREGDNVVALVEFPAALSVEPNEPRFDANAFSNGPAESEMDLVVSRSDGALRDWVLLTEGVMTTAALGVGIGFHIAVSSADRRADDGRALLATESASPSAQCGAPSSSVQTICDDLARAVADGKSRRRVSTIGFVGAGVSAAALVGTWLLWPSDVSSSSTALRLLPLSTARGDASFVVTGAF